MSKYSNNRVIVRPKWDFKIFRNRKRVKDQLLPASNKLINWTGRVDLKNPERPKIYWTGTKARISFTGSSHISILLDDELGINQFYLILDNDRAKAFKFHCKRGIREYELFIRDDKEQHTLELFKCTEYFHGYSVFHGFKFNPGTSFIEPVAAKHKILFFGDSITSGMGVLAPKGLRFALPKYTDHFLSYAAISSYRLHADHTAISRSGIGFMESFFSINMPELCLRLRPDHPEPIKNADKENPDLIVVNLGQNDSTLTLYKDRFLHSFTGNKIDYIIARYKDFIRLLLDFYTGVPILCTLGSMDATREGSPWPEYIRTAVSQLIKEYPSAILDTLIFPWQGDQNHPSAVQQELMAQQLHKKILEMQLW